MLYRAVDLFTFFTHDGGCFLFDYRTVTGCSHATRESAVVVSVGERRVVPSSVVELVMVVCGVELYSRLFSKEA